MNGPSAWRPLGFLLLMVGFGLRLDTDWHGLAWLFLLAGAVGAGIGLWPLARAHERVGAFVPPAGKG